MKTSREATAATAAGRSYLGATTWDEIVPRALALIVALAVVGVVFWRIRRGFDFTDEAFYIAIPARFTLGDWPFSDELNIGQNGGILIWPFVFVYHAAFGFTGIFFFIRILLILFLSLVGWSAFTLARERLPWSMSLLVGVACIPFIPYGCPALSYNTLGAGLLTLGLFLVARVLVQAATKTSSLSSSSIAEDPGQPAIYRDALFWAGFAHGAAAFAYPTLFLPVAGSLSVIVVMSEHRVRSVFRYCAGGAAFVLLVSPLFLHAGVSRMRDVMTYLNADKAAGSNFTLENIEAMWMRFVHLHPDIWKTGLIIAVLALLVRRAPLIAGIFIPTIALIAREPLPASGGINYLAVMGLYTPLVGLALRDSKFARIVVVAVWFPSALAAAAMGLSSGNGVLASGLGFYPAAMATGLLIAAWMNELSKQWTVTAFRSVIHLAPMTFAYALVQYIAGDEASIYRDGKIAELSSPITEGPYKGLLTTSKRKEWLRGFMADLKEHNTGKRTLFYFDFPAGYLFASKRPLVASSWVFPSGPVRSGFDTRYFQAHAVPNEIVWRFGGTVRAGTYIDLAVADATDLVRHRDGYSIYRVRDPSIERETDADKVPALPLLLP